jgi:homoserine kinase type II
MRSPVPAPATEQRLEHWRAVRDKATQLGKEWLLPLIRLQENATVHVEIEHFSKCRTGWAHRDLWADNLLFIENRVSAVLDFDRFRYDYPCLDVWWQVNAQKWRLKSSSTA